MTAADGLGETTARAGSSAADRRGPWDRMFGGHGPGSRKTELRTSRSRPGIAVIRCGSMAFMGLVAFVSVSTGEKAPGLRDPGMRRIVAGFESAASAAPRRFRSEVMTAVEKCGTHCDRETVVRAVVDGATRAERELSSALQAAGRRLSDRAKSVRGADAVSGAPGDLTRSIARLETASLRFSAEMSEGLAALKGAGFGGDPFLTTLQVRLASLVYRIPIAFGTIFTVHVLRSPTAWVHVDGYAPADAPVTVSFTCGGAPQTFQALADADGRWGISVTVVLSGSTVCTMTATAGTGISAGTVTTDLHFY